MNFNTNVLKSVVLVSVGALMFAGCSSKETLNDYNGKFVDRPVQGITFSCGDVLDETNETGEFGICPAGSTVTFTVGNVVLGTSGVTEDFIFTPNDIAEDEEVIEVAQFLQSLDTDTSNEDTIVITQDVRTAINNSVAPEVDTPIADLNVTDNIKTIVEQIQDKIPDEVGIVLESVTQDEAQAELDNTETEIEEGDIKSPVQPGDNTTQPDDNATD